MWLACCHSKPMSLEYMCLLNQHAHETFPLLILAKLAVFPPKEHLKNSFVTAHGRIQFNYIDCCGDFFLFFATFQATQIYLEMNPTFTQRSSSVLPQSCTQVSEQLQRSSREAGGRRQAQGHLGAFHLHIPMYLANIYFNSVLTSQIVPLWYFPCPPSKEKSISQYLTYFLSFNSELIKHRIKFYSLIISVTIESNKDGIF